MSEVNFFPARIPFVSQEGTLTPMARGSLLKIVSLLGGQNGILPTDFAYQLGDGSVVAPSLFFSQEPGLGFYRAATGTIAAASGGDDIIRLSPNGLQVSNLVPGFIYNDLSNHLESAPATNGQLLIGKTGFNPVAATLTGSSSIDVASGAGSVALSLSATYSGQASITALGTIITGTWNANAIAANYGGTGQTSYAVGDILYASATTTLSKLPLGAANRVFGVNNAGTTPEYKAVNGTTNQVVVTHGANSITFSLPQSIATTSAPTFDNLTLANGFGCNGKTPQTEVAVNAAIAGTATASYTVTEQTMLNDLKALANQMRAALIANGILV